MCRRVRDLGKLEIGPWTKVHGFSLPSQPRLNASFACAGSKFRQHKFLVPSATERELGSRYWVSAFTVSSGDREFKWI
jgi:hypothetical protein